METVTDFILGGSKITAHVDCSHEIKRRLLLRRKNYDKTRQHIKKQTNCFNNKCLSSQNYGFFPVVMHGYENCTIKKSEHIKIDVWGCDVGKDS